MSEFTVKCSLARLGALPEIRRQIDIQVARHHALALRGSHVASHTALRMLRAGTVPAITKQNWWNWCFNSCGTLQGRRNICTKDPEIEQSIQELFGMATPIDSDKSWPFVNELSKQTVTMVQNMLASNFHAQLDKAFRREVIIYEFLSGLTIEKKIRWKLLRHFKRFATGHMTPTPLPAGVPLALQAQLHSLASGWKQRFGARVCLSEGEECFGTPVCPTAEFIYNQKPLHTNRAVREGSCRYLEGIFEWMFVMQEHRLTCLQSLEGRIPSSDGRTAKSILGKYAKALALLPVVAFNVPHIAISRDNGLQSLYTGAQLPAVKCYYRTFPNLRKLDRGCVCHYIRTDGVTVSLTMKRNLPDGEEPPKKKRRVTGQVAERGPQPQTPSSTQRLVGIDPGRRDMIALVSNEGDAFTVSTKSYVQASGSAAAARHTKSLLGRTPMGDGTTLLARLNTLPSRRDLDQWDVYLQAVLPLLDTIMETYRTKSLRRWKFHMFQKRDRALDALCLRITAKKGNVLVAFGDASSCSSGFGSAPAPLGRLRKRLVVQHGASVTLVEERYTSQMCCKCNEKLREVSVTHSLKKIQKSEVWVRRLAKSHFRSVGKDLYIRKQEAVTEGQVATHSLTEIIENTEWLRQLASRRYRSVGNDQFTERPHGLRRCAKCRTRKGTPLFCHRDLNAARNIFDIYLKLASGQGRPPAFEHEKEV